MLRAASFLRFKVPPGRRDPQAQVMSESLADWTPQRGAPPELRIGIVLPEDQKSALALSCAEGALRVDGLRAGRGFHWEKSISQRLPGVLEIRHGEGGLIAVCRLPVEDYLLGVVTSEMSGECPPEYMKAQCVVARSWTLANSEQKHRDLGIDYCNDDCCQRFQGVEGITPAARSAVERTAGEVLLTEDGAVVDANYSKSCGGIVEDPACVWPDTPKPGLSALVDAPASSRLHGMFPLQETDLRAYLTGDWLGACDAYCSDRAVPPEAIGRYLGRVDTPEGFFRWEVVYQREQLESLLNRKRAGSNRADEVAMLRDMRVTRRGVSGRATEIELDYVTRDGKWNRHGISDQYCIRRMLHESFLYSSAFMIELKRQPDGTLEEIRLIGAGWGHGAGFCQIGGLGMALQGFGYREILAHYFPQARLSRIY